jgi:diguanylate cyclase (GGDEF)-like protein
MISRKHSEISWDGTKITLRDLDSTNGTFVDGVALTSHPKSITPENRLQIGKMVLKIDFKEPTDDAIDREFFEAATTDPLTKAPNRRTFIDRSVGELASARRKNQSVHVILCEVDHFKKLTDDWGASAGDMILKSLAQIFTRNKRESDLFARFSSEEFILLLPEMTKADAVKSAERLRTAVEKGTVLRSSDRTRTDPHGRPVLRVQRDTSGILFGPPFIELFKEQRQDHRTAGGGHRCSVHHGHRQGRQGHQEH